MADYRISRRPLAGLAAVLAVAAFAAAPAMAKTMSWNVKLTGQAEVPGPGDPNASGMAKVSVDGDTDMLCYDITTSGLGKATGAHVHQGMAGQAGAVVVPLETPLGGASKACAKIDPKLAGAIMANPKDYYVNVHSDTHKMGAIRGQLAT